VSFQARESQEALGSIKMSFVDKLASVAAAAVEKLDGNVFW
jgi:hypothetical protein